MALVEKVLYYTQRLNLLLVEDDPILLEALKSQFSMLFQSVITAENGLEGWQRYQENTADLIIMDLEMPLMKGDELASKIKEDNPESVILVMSAFTDPAHLIPLINLHIDGFIEKPFQHEKLLETLLGISKRVSDTKALQTYREKLEYDTLTLTKRLEQIENRIHKTKSENSPDLINTQAIVDTLEREKELICLNWCNHHTVSNILMRHSISPDFFRKFFGIRVLDYLIGVIRLENEAGNCPVIIAMIDFFQHKHLPLWDLYIICSGFKNTLLEFVLERFEYNHMLYEELSLMMDRNFAGVVRNFLKMSRFEERYPQSAAHSTPIIELAVHENGLACSLPAMHQENEAARACREYVMDQDLQELKELENDIDDLAISIAFERSEPSECVQLIGEKLGKYGAILISYPVLDQLGEQIGRLSHHFISSVEEVQNNPEKLRNVSLLIESFVNDLVLWRKEVFELCSQDPQYLNQSFNGNIETIINFMKDLPADEEENSIEFF